MEKNKICPALWLSGFFGMGAVVHFLRFISGVSLSVAGHEIPLAVSAVVFLVMSGLSLGALYLSFKRPFCASSHGSDCHGGKREPKTGSCCGH